MRRSRCPRLRLAALLLLAGCDGATSPEVLRTETVDLLNSYVLDLDSGVVNGTVADSDLWHEAISAQEHNLVPQSGALIAAVGTQEPGHDRCQSVAMDTTSQSLQAVQPGAWFCARSDLGRLAKVRLDSIPDAGSALLQLTYTVWR